MYHVNVQFPGYKNGSTRCKNISAGWRGKEVLQVIHIFTSYRNNLKAREKVSYTALAKTTPAEEIAWLALR
jgi:hypothetical protein